ncbi:penicillin-binding protein 2 [Bifidobacterium sp. B4001]|uniref:peptidoglycan D,D-transpeptidase FtsI family protein n=1 Tax=Bifidobacterium TaxID=1678 RepID=UPI001C69479C|nr:MULTISPECIES: penicillin-binding protein 2 [Bifidobacterium]MCX8672598.1 penicillin-binding protein 2 [Bifidobacterium sp. B4079]MCX8681031.1 penicillin-binding protein 2 [Bifidobacterium sp. B4001]QYN60149.1 penicillin-binding protein 2 [Bifidobacterium asteroides]
MSGKGTKRSWRLSFCKRSLSVGLILILVAALALGKLAYIQLFDGRSMAQAAAAGRTVPHTIKAQRGRILDVNGRVLAQSLERYNIIGDPEAAASFIPINCTKRTGNDCHSIKGHPVGADGAAGVARLLAPALGMNAMELGGKLSVPGRYVLLAKRVTPEVKRSIDKLGLQGIITAELSSERTYPHADLMGALIGGIDDSGKGVAGIEQMENWRLTGTDGYTVYQQGMLGQEIPGTVTRQRNPVNGKDVRLTIDQDVLWYVRQALKSGCQNYHADWALAVVQDTHTNEILALADTDDYQAGSDQAKVNSSRAVAETFEPGSVGKTISAAGMLQEQAHSMTDRFTVPDHITIDNQQYKDSFNHGEEHWTLAGILQNSSNVGMVMAGQKYPDQKRYDYLTRFGIGHVSALGLPGESKGLLTTPQTWDRRTRNTVLFGQGYATNAVQLTNAIATLANKGVRSDQTIIRGQGGVKANQVRVVDEKVAAEVMNAMESVSEKYDKTVKVEGYRIAAKTGTAEVADSSGRLSGIVSDWVGILPADDPRFVITVVLKNPHSSAGIFGGVTAGPIFAQIGEFLMQKYQVPTSQPRTDAIPVTW